MFFAVLSKIIAFHTITLSLIYFTHLVENISPLFVTLVLPWRLNQTNTKMTRINIQKGNPITIYPSAASLSFSILNPSLRIALILKLKKYVDDTKITALQSWSLKKGLKEVLLAVWTNPKMNMAFANSINHPVCLLVHPFCALPSMFWPLICFSPIHKGLPTSFSLYRLLSNFSTHLHIPGAPNPSPSVHFLSAGQYRLLEEGEYEEDPRPLAPFALGEIIWHNIVWKRATKTKIKRQRKGFNWAEVNSSINGKVKRKKSGTDKKIIVVQMSLIRLLAKKTLKVY